ncbi:MAG: hypothetical protein KIG15_05325, partial [Coriobacteriales bacterium]|nr:hypothetical protein [Coriobacteriales bacterium]
MENLITRDDVEQAARAVRALAPGFEPEVAIVLGSGMGELAEQIDQLACTDYNSIPHMVASTAQGHKGRLVLGVLE